MEFDKFGAAFDDFEVIGHEPYYCAVPRSIPPKVRASIRAAFIANSGDTKSIDYLLREYGQKWGEIRQRADVDELIARAQSESIRAVVQVTEWWVPGDHRDRELGPFAASAALMRLHTSFRSASLLVQTNSPYDAAAVLRLILEQIAWAFAVHELPPDRVLKQSPTKVTPLKTLFPTAGIFYGRLTDLAHIGEDWHKAFVEWEDQPMVVMRETKYNAFLSFALLLLADWYWVVAEWIHHRAVPGARYVGENDQGNVIISRNRALEQLVDECEEVFGRSRAWGFGK